MINLFTKSVMVLSFLYYGILMTGFWLSALARWHNEVWAIYEFPLQEIPPPAWLLFLALVVTVLAFFSLGHAYRAVWKILNGGSGQDFLKLARRLHQLALGLVGFWIGFSFINGIMPFFLAAYLPTAVTQNVEASWDFLDVEIIYLILPVAIFAVSRTLERAWKAEDEVRSFL